MLRCALSGKTILLHHANISSCNSLLVVFPCITLSKRIALWGGAWDGCPLRACPKGADSSARSEVGMNAKMNSGTASGTRRWLRPAWGAILGGILGFGLLHPYVMFMGSMGVISLHTLPSSSGELSAQALWGLEYSMIAMAVPLALFGAVSGLMAGAYLNRADRLHQLLLEQERNAASLEAVKALTATLSHYLLNANMIMGGKVRHCRRLEPPPEILESLRIIEEQGRTIDAVVGSLREVARIAIRDDASGQVPMIDLTRDLEERLRQIGGGALPPDDAGDK